MFSLQKKNTKESRNQNRLFILLFLVSASIILASFFVSSSARAATGINKQINFQGKVTNTDGTNVTNASYTFLFCLYTTGSPATACTSGANNDAVWRESKSITVTDGIFQTNLGDTTTLPGSVDFNTDNIYLGINFNANGQMTPLVRFTASPYAMNADKVHGLTVTDTTGTLTIPNGKTVQFGDAFTTSGAFPLTLATTASTSVTLPTTGTLLSNTESANQTITSTQTSGTELSVADSTAITAATTGLSISLTGTGAFDQTGLSFNLTNASGTNLNDILGSGSAWKVSRAGVGTFAGLTSTGAIAANGGITFDNTTDTLGAHTLAGTIDANANIIQNIGNTGTDFIASTGALTLAGVLTANGGISLAGSQSITGAALSFIDLASVTQGSTALQGLRLPNAASATPSNPTSGEGFLAWDAAGNQLITYNGSVWTTVGGGSVSIGSTIGSATQGSVLFAGASGVLAQDNANFFWDGTGHRLSIGTASPSEVKLTVAGGGIIATGTIGSDTVLTTNGAGTRMMWYPNKAAFRAGGIGGTQWDNANIGSYSVAFGANSTASGFGSTAFSSGAVASNSYALAFGLNDTASGTASTAFGSTNTASGEYSTASGAVTSAIGNYSFTAGVFTSADAYNQMTVGAFNMPKGSETAGSWVTTDPLFVVGNGTGSGASRSTALMILKDGSVGIGTVSPSSLFSIGSTSQFQVNGSGAITASTGITSSGAITANGGISLAGSQSITGAALSFIDLASVTQGSTALQGLRLPNAASATPSNPTSGEGFLAWDAAGNQLITYNGSAWTTVGGGSVSIGSTIGSATQGSVLFAGASGVLAQNNANFFWDNTNNTLKLGGGTNVTYGTPAAVPLDISGTFDTFLQANIQNKSTGTSASSDWIATADNGTDSTNYIDFGINGSGYTGGVFGGADDAYLYNMGNDLLIGTGTAAKNLTFMTGGTTEAGNARATFDGNGNFLVTGGNLAYTNGVGLLNLANATNFTGVSGQIGSGLQIKPAFTLTEPGSGNYTQYGANIDMSSVAVTAGAGTSEVTGLRIAGTSDADAAVVKGIDIATLSGTAAIETAINIGAGWDSGITLATSGTGTGLSINNTGTGNSIAVAQSAINRFTVANTGALTINGTDSSITRTASADFSLGTVGSNLVNTNGRVQLADGTPGNSGQGVLTTASQPALDAGIGAGAMSLTRADGKYLLIKGGATGGTSIYDPVAGTFTNSQTIVCNGTTTVGIGAIALPRPNGMYTLICGVGSSGNTATSNVDPMGVVPSAIGPPLLTAVTAAGTVAYKRPDGKYLVTLGASTPTGATAMFDPVVNTLNIAGPTATTGTWSTGVLALPMPDGRALIVNGGAVPTTNIYNPNGVSATIGTFTAGPSLDGAKAANSCRINGVGSVALKRQDGKYVILSQSGAEAVFDPSAVTMTCSTGVANVAALGDGAHAIPLQNGKFLIFAGGNTTTAFVYNQDTDTFSTYGGTTPTAITTGAHSILRTDGAWQIITGTTTTTNNFNTNLPMSDPYPSQIAAGAPSAGGACDNGNHSYYVSFIMAGSVESELSNKSNIASCSSLNSTGTVALSNIPVGPAGTTARKIYRTTAGDTGVPKLLNTTGSCSTSGGGSGITDNTSTTCTDTTADASLGATYSVTPSPTWYTSEDMSNTSISASSTMKWTAQLEAVYSATRNSQSPNTAFKVMQFFVKTAVNSSGCATPLANASWQEIQNPGDSIRAVPGANCAKVAIHYNRAMPKKLYDDRGTWTGNNTTVLRYDYTTPSLFDYTIDNSAVVKRTSFDFSTPDSTQAVATAVPAQPISRAPGGSGACTNGTHYWFVSFVINGVESQLSPVSAVQTCSGSNNGLFSTAGDIPLGPSGTTARKIYRTAAGMVATDTPFYDGVISDNSTTTYTDGVADGSLGAAFAQMTPSGPVTTRAEGTRVEAVNNQLSLPWGRITPTFASTQIAGVGQAYMGVFGVDHPALNNPAGMGTIVIARDDKTFLVLEGGGATADIYDSATQTFTNQSGVGNVPTAAVGPGSFAIKRPNGKFLVTLGAVQTTNIYDQYAPPGARFTAGPNLTAAAGQGAFAIPNTDGTFTILPGNAGATTSIYDPVRNTMTVGPLQTTGTNLGGLAIPLLAPNSNIYKVIVGTTVGGGVGAVTMNYNANTKVFIAGQALGVGVGSGAFAFQRQDGFWILVKGESAANTLGNLTSIINPYSGVETVNATNMQASIAGRGSHVIPRADGTFLIIGGNSLASATTGVSIGTQIYFPWGGAWNATAGTNSGTFAAGPNLMVQGGLTAAIAAPGTVAPSVGGLCDSGTHLWRYTQVINGVESALSLAGTQQACNTTGNLQTEILSSGTILAGPTGTTARKIYRTKVGTTSPYYYVGTINDNTTTTFTDALADSVLGATYWSGGPGDGALSFQRPDGKFVTLFGGTTWTTPAIEMGSTTVNVYDAGWYSDGQYLSEEMNVPALAANSTIDWQQTPDQYVRMAVRAASTQTALGVAGYTPVSSPGGTFNNAGGETWAQVQVNFRRDFPTYSGSLNGVYVSSGGMAYPYRTISTPTVNSYQITNGMDLMTLQNNGLNVMRVTSDGNILSSPTGGFFSGGADLAENYTSTQALAKGEVVIIDQAKPTAVLRSTGQYQQTVVGVVSTAPGFVAGGYTADSYPVALVGRVPVRVSTENGPIAAGDHLTSASIPGYAMKATQAGRIIGEAMEAFDPATATACPSQGLGNLATTKCGMVTVFVNLSDYYGAPLEMVMAGQQFGSSDTNGTDGVSTAAASNDTDGLVTPANVRLAVSAPTREEQMLTFLKKMRDTALANGTPASEVLASRVSATDEIISPTIVTDTLFAKHIKADSIEGLQVFTDQLSSLSEKYAGLAAAQTTTDTGTPADAAAQANLAVAMKDLSAETIMVKLDGTIVGKLTVAGGLVIGNDAQFSGNTVFNKLASFFGDTFFKGKVSFDTAPTFSSDTAGFAVIAEGQRSVDVTFDTPYAKQPIVSATITNDENPLTADAQKDVQLATDIAAVEDDFTGAYFGHDVKYIVTKKSVNGFTITLNKATPRELQFSWVALAVKDGKTFRSANPVVPITAPVDTAVPAVSTPDANVVSPSQGSGTPTSPSVRPFPSVPVSQMTVAPSASATFANTPPPAAITDTSVTTTATPTTAP